MLEAIDLGRCGMWARMASFEGGDTERLTKMNEERMQSGEMNLPEGMRRALLLASSDGNKRVFITFFDDEDAIKAAEARFESMGDEIPEDVRGRRTSVESYEIVFDQTP
jgi:hypothetical protein